MQTLPKLQRIPRPWPLSPAALAFRETEVLRRNGDEVVVFVPPGSVPKTFLDLNEDLDPTRWVGAQWSAGTDPPLDQPATVDNASVAEICLQAAPTDETFIVQETKAMIRWLDDEAELRIKDDRPSVRNLGVEFAQASLRLKIELKEAGHS